MIDPLVGPQFIVGCVLLQPRRPRRRENGNSQSKMATQYFLCDLRIIFAQTGRLLPIFEPYDQDKQAYPRAVPQQEGQGILDHVRLRPPVAAVFSSPGREL